MNLAARHLFELTRSVAILVTACSATSAMAAPEMIEYGTSPHGEGLLKQASESSRRNAPVRPSGTFGVPPNDQCSDAELISELPALVAASTVGATPDTTPGCSGDVPRGGGVWYRVVGTGGTLTATTCLPGTDFDTVLSVYCGDCEELVCVAVNDDACSGGQSRINWCSENGRAYFVLVAGYASEAGQFELEVSDDGTACGDTTACEPCTVDIPPDAIEEDEAWCVGDGPGSTNGGCDSDPPAFGVIVPGDIVSGTASAGLVDGVPTRDTDWYEFELAFPARVTWQGSAEFPLLLGLIDGRDGCRPSLAFDIGFDRADPCATATVSEVLPAGVYYAWAGPASFSGVPCGSQYVVELTAEPVGGCDVAGECVLTTQADCQSLGGVFRGDGVVCEQTGYRAELSDSPFEDISSTGVPLVLADDDAAEIAIGFQFGFYGQIFTEVGVSSNGYLTFGIDLTDSSNDAIPSPRDPNALIAPLWDDLNPGAGGAVAYQLLGTAPERRLVVQWTSVPQFGRTDANTFQVALLEGEGVIEFRYGQISEPAFVGDRTIGVESQTGDRGTSVDPYSIESGDSVTLTRSELTRPIARPGGPYALSATTSLVEIDGSESSDADGVITGYQWDLGDDGTADDLSRTGAVAEVLRDEAIGKGLSLSQAVPLSLVVTDNDGLRGRDATDVIWSNTPPTAAANGPYGPLDPVDGIITLAGEVGDIDEDFPVGESVAAGWSTMPISDASQLDQSLATGADVEVTYELLLDARVNGPSGDVLYLNAADVSGAFASSPATIVLKSPDLTVISVNVPGNASPGEEVQVSWTVRNDGDATTLTTTCVPPCGTWSDQVGIATASDGSGYVPLSVVPVFAEIEPGETRTFSADVVLPTASGELYVVVDANADARLVELIDVGSNRRVSDSTIDIGAPDFEGDAPLVATPAIADEVLEVTYTVRNSGTADSLASRVDQIWLSEDDSIDPAVDHLLVQFTAPPLAQNTPETRTVSGTVPETTIGPQRVLINLNAGRTIPELDLSNNQLTSEVFDIEPPLRGDLVPASSVAVVPGNPVAGSVAEVTWEVRNGGRDVISDSWLDRVLLSRDQDASSDDIELARIRTIRMLDTSGAASVYSETIPVTIPIGIEGEYFVVVEVDAEGDILELDEENNDPVSTSALVIEQPDLPDIVIEPFTVVSAGVTEEEVTVSWSGQNAGERATAGGWTDRVYLSIDDDLDIASDFRGGITAVPSPAEPGEPYSAEVTFELPTQPGSYWVFAVADSNDVVEEGIDEANNVTRSLNQITVAQGPRPDLEPFDVVGPSPAARGESITVTWKTRNNGGREPDRSWRELVSLDPVQSGKPTVNIFISVYEGDFTDTDFVQRSITVPLPDIGGDYVARVCVDPDGVLNEDSEANNCADAPEPSEFVKPDLVAGAVLAPMTATAGEGIDLSYTVSNQATAPATGFWIDQVWLEPTGSRGISDVDYIVAVLTLVAEGDPAGDFNGSGITDIDDLLWALDRWRVGDDALPRGSDQPVLLTTNVRPRSLAPNGDSYTATLTNVTVPDRIEGEFRVVVITDFDDRLDESEEAANNQSSAVNTTLVVQPPRPNLIVADVVTPTGGVVTTEVVVQYSIANIAAPLDGIWVERIIAIPTSGTSGSNVVLGEEVRSGVLSIDDGAVPQMATVRLPAGAGDYRLAVVVDAADQINEGLEGGEDDNQTIDESTFEVVALDVVGTPTVLDVPPSAAVVLNGLATDPRTGEPVAGALLEVAFDVKGVRRSYVTQPRVGSDGIERQVPIETDSTGAFSFDLPIVPTEGGRFTVFAGTRNGSADTLLGSFDLYSLTVSPRSNGVVISPFTNGSKRFTIRTPGDLPQTGLTASVFGDTSGLEIEASLSSSSIAPNGSVQLDMTASADGSFVGNRFFDVVIASAEGATAEIQFGVQARPPVPELVRVGPEPTVSLLRGDQAIAEFTIQNVGGAPALNLGVTVPSDPSLDWVDPLNPSLPRLEPGESVVVQVQLRPDDDALLGAYPIPVTVAPQNLAYGVSLDINVDIGSNATATYRVRVEDERTYWSTQDYQASGGPPVSGARVRLLNATTLEPLFETVTTAGGDPTPDDPDPANAIFTGVPEGVYILEVEGPNHLPDKKTVLIEESASTEPPFRVFTPYQTVSYTWTVDEVQFDDITIVELITEFETNVPAPAVVVDPPLLDLTALTSDVQVVEFEIRNEGLITAENAQFVVGTHPNWRLTPLVTEIGDLPAQQSRTVPVLIERITSRPSAGQEPQCYLELGVRTELVCFGRNAYYVRVPVILGDITGCIPDCNGCDPFWWVPPIFDCELTNLDDCISVPEFDWPFDIETSSLECRECDENFVGERQTGGADTSEIVNEALQVLNIIITAADTAITLGSLGTICLTSEEPLVAGSWLREECCLPEGYVSTRYEDEGRARARLGIGLGGCGPGEVIDLVSQVFSEDLSPETVQYLNDNYGFSLDPNATEARILVNTSIPGQIGGKAELTLNATDLRECGEIFSLPCIGGSVGLVDVGVTSGFTAGVRFTNLINGDVVNATVGGEVVMNGTGRLGYDCSIGEPIIEYCLQTRLSVGGQLSFDGIGANQPPPVFRGLEWCPENFTVPGFPILNFKYPPDLAGCGCDSSPPMPRPGEPGQDAFGAIDAVLAEAKAEILGIHEQIATRALDRDRPRQIVYSAASPRASSHVAIGAGSNEGVCAGIKLRLEQEIALTRTAFQGTLELENDDPVNPVAGVLFLVDIIDEFGNPANSKFVIQPPVLDGLTAVDGTGVVDPSSSGRASWLIVPTRDAAPAEDTVYFIGGFLEFNQGGRGLAVPVEPVRITVRPDPLLRLKYFWERDVFADDPFTADIIEQSLPFALGLQMINDGPGIAQNVRVTSSEPEIIDNSRGLLIGFDLIGTKVEDRDVTPSLSVNLGDIQPLDLGTAQWLMTSTLQGQFVSYEARILRNGLFNDERIALIDSVDIFELIHPVLAPGGSADTIPDFLTNELLWPNDPFELPGNDLRIDLPDRVHLSDGTVEPVVFVEGVTSQVDAGALRPTASVSMTPPSSQFFYTKFPDPFAGRLPLESVVRADGVELPVGTNVWQTDRVFIEQQQRPLSVDLIHIFDRGGSGQYTLTFSPDEVPPDATQWLAYTNLPGSIGLDADLPGGTYSEPRLAGLARLSVAFSEPVTFDALGSATGRVDGVDAFGQSLDLSGTTAISTLQSSGEMADIEFVPPLTTPGIYCVELVGVTDLAGNPLGANARVQIAVAPADITGDRRVNNTDVGAILSVLGDAVDPSDTNLVRADLDEDGTIGASDQAAVVSGRGLELRFAATPCIVDLVQRNGDGTTPLSASGSGGLATQQRPEPRPEPMDSDIDGVGVFQGDLSSVVDRAAEEPPAPHRGASGAESGDRYDAVAVRIHAGTLVEHGSLVEALDLVGVVQEPTAHHEWVVLHGSDELGLRGGVAALASTVQSAGFYAVPVVQGDPTAVVASNQIVLTAAPSLDARRLRLELSSRGIPVTGLPASVSGVGGHFLIDVAARSQSVASRHLEAVRGLFPEAMASMVQVRLNGRSSHDVDGDGRVTYEDVLQIIDVLGGHREPSTEDVNTDGVVDVLDLAEVAGAVIWR